MWPSSAHNTHRPPLEIHKLDPSSPITVPGPTHSPRLDFFVLRLSEVVDLLSGDGSSSLDSGPPGQCPPHALVSLHMVVGRPGTGPYCNFPGMLVIYDGPVVPGTGMGTFKEVLRHPRCRAEDMLLRTIPSCSGEVVLGAGDRGDRQVDLALDDGHLLVHSPEHRLPDAPARASR